MAATPIPPNVAPFTAAELAIVTGGVLHRGEPGSTHAGVCTDSRAIVAGNVYVPLVGASFDGHDYLGAAFAAGATAAVLRHGVPLEGIPEGHAVVLVDDTLVALGALGRAHRRRWAASKGGRAVVVAITGSAGKTSTKELCAALLSARLGPRVHATAGNLNNRIGLPMVLLGLTAEHDAVVLEAGTSVRGEIATLAAIALPDVAVLTHVGVAHAEGLLRPNEDGLSSPQQAVAREKRALLLAASACAIVCSDDPWAAAARLDLPAPSVRTFGRAKDADWRVFSAELRADGTAHVTVDRPTASAELPRLLEVSLPLIGHAAASNLAGALCAADATLERLGLPQLDEPAVQRAIAERVQPVHGRLCPRRRTDGALVIDDSYNASPSAYREAIRTARAIALAGERRLLIVAGEMRELGAFAGRAHEEVGKVIAEAAPALVITIGTDAERIGFVCRAAGVEVQHAGSAQRAATRIVPVVGPGDVVLVKGSRGVGTEVVVDAILARGGEIGNTPSRIDPGGAGPHGPGA